MEEVLPDAGDVLDLLEARVRRMLGTMMRMKTRTRMTWMVLMPSCRSLYCISTKADLGPTAGSFCRVGFVTLFRRFVYNTSNH